MDPTILLFVLAAVLVLLGIAGVVFPALPGSPLVFGGLWIAAWAEGFAHVGFGWLVLLAAMAVAAWAVDFVAGAFGASRFGASKRAVLGAGLGALVGLFFGIPGVLLGPFIGATIGELTAHGDLRRSGRAGIGATIGLALGAAAKLALAFSMVGVFAAMRIV